MKRPHRYLILYLSTLFVVAALMASSTSSRATRSGTQLARTSDNADLADLLGSWSGTWNDTIYSVGGSLSFDITADAGVYHATGDIGLETLGLGVESGTASGNEQLGALVFSFSSATVGSGDGSINALTGITTGSGSVIAAIGFGAFVFQGSVSGDIMSGLFDFTSPTGGAGVAILTRTGTAVEQQPWSDVKLRYRDDAVQDN